MPQHAIGAPFLGELHHRARKIAVELFELGFEARKQRERVGRRPGKSGYDLVAIKAPQLLGGSLQYFRTQRHLTVAGHHHFPAPANAEDGCGTYSFFHVGLILDSLGQRPTSEETPFYRTSHY